MANLLKISRKAKYLRRNLPLAALCPAVGAGLRQRLIGKLPIKPKVVRPPSCYFLPTIGSWAVCRPAAGQRANNQVKMWLWRPNGPGLCSAAL